MNSDKNFSAIFEAIGAKFISFLLQTISLDLGALISTEFYRSALPLIINFLCNEENAEKLPEINIFEAINLLRKKFVNLDIDLKLPQEFLKCILLKLNTHQENRQVYNMIRSLDYRPSFFDNDTQIITSQHYVKSQFLSNFSVISVFQFFG